jgi:hypothetical protein
MKSFNLVAQPGQKLVTPDMFIRVNNDVNGNPRYVLHFLNALTPDEREARTSSRYDIAILRAQAIGGRKYHNRSYGGGLVFQSYSLDETCYYLNQAIAKAMRLENAGAVREIVRADGSTAGFIMGDPEFGYYGALCHPLPHIFPRNAGKFATLGACARAVRSAGFSV